ncbi:MAG: DUF2244 domain-containing protein [Roseiarcus sp.]|jgi:uncharacterized membrane protein
MIDAPLTNESPILAVRLTPHRSLDPAAVRILMAATFAVSAVVSLPFYLIGAWPIVGFFGLDVALLYLAFRANFRAARAYEDFHLTYFQLLFARVSARGARREWRFNPAWVRIERVDHQEFGPQRLSLLSRGRRWEVAKFLGPDQKAEFATTLAEALAEARRGPRFSH